MFAMESGRSDRYLSPQMFQKGSTMSFLGRRSLVPRPLSEATEIYDTDIEDDEYSPASLATDSTRSSYNEAVTPPLTAGLGGFEFHFDDKTVEGPYGPHLFVTGPKHDSTELPIAMSPVFPDTPKAPVRNIATLNTAVAELDEAAVRSWSPEQVAGWMVEAGFESSVVEKFLIHDICGTILLDLQFEDLKELDISSFGKRHQVMTSIRSLRNSTSITNSVARRPSQASRSNSIRRGRHFRNESEDITPADSASIVAIEQILPKEHKCSKGEDCPKWQKQQRKIQQLEEQLAADVRSIVTPSVVAPSVVASSDIFGPTKPFTITCERLSSLEPRDPLENVRNFLDFQHVNSPTASTFPQEPAPFTQNLNGLPKLTIPTENKGSESPYHTPISAFRNPTEFQAQLKAQLVEDPYHYGGVASPVDVYKLETPMTVTELPVTALPIDPCSREVSHSVPPEMRFGSSAATTITASVESINRPFSTQPSLRRHNRRKSFVPNMTALAEDMMATTPLVPPVASEVELATHSGYMRRRKTTRLMTHEWETNYFTLSGTQLGIAKDADSYNFESIDIEDYTLHAYTGVTTTSSKFSAAFFKKSMGSGNSDEPCFTFSLVPDAVPKGGKKRTDKDKALHFAVGSGSDRVEWMRKLMLAKAMKKNDGRI